jgi:CXXC zinc finger domain
LFFILFTGTGIFYFSSRCGKCEACQNENCGECENCKDMTK